MKVIVKFNLLYNKSFQLKTLKSVFNFRKPICEVHKHMDHIYKTLLHVDNDIDM